MTTATIHNILDVEFETYELKDIVMHGMSAGVPGFTYTSHCVAKFNEHDDEIEEFLSDWYKDNMGEDDYISAIAGSEMNSYPHPVGSIDELKNRMVWAYVELKAYDILNEEGIEV